ncbi:MAG: RNA polymerase sigma factor [Candidatus Zixiibacteriota bacterium]
MALEDKTTETENDEKLDKEEDRDYVRRSKHGDENAFGFLYRKYREKVYLHIYYMVSNKDDAMDLSTDSFIKAYKSIERFREESSFYTWILSISTRVAIDYLRKRKKTVSLQHASDIIDDPVDHAENIDRERITNLIEEGQKQLSPKEKACFTLRFFEEKSVKETAQIMGIKNGTVKSLYYRAFNKMKDYISKIYLR